MFYCFINRFKLSFIRLRRKPRVCPWGSILLFCFFIVSCSPTDISPPASSNSLITDSRVVLAKDFSPGQLEAHYLKHRQEFGDITQDEYLNKARDLLNSSLNQDILEKIRVTGDILRYRISTQEFAVMAKDGRIKTYFKSNYKYWSKQ